MTAPSPVGLDDAALIRLGQEALVTEAAAIAAVSDRLGTDFVRACRVCLAARGRVVVIGMGKSGHVGRKIAATLASTGTPAFFVHPAEAQHGDIGMITHDDVVLLLSNSGETNEVLAVEAVVLLERHRITALMVVDEDRRILGALNVHDLLRAGVM